MRQGQPGEAEAGFRRALALKPDYADAHYNLGVVLKDQGRLDEAAAAFGQALALKPDFAEGHNNLGIILLDQKQPQAAAERFARVLALKPGHAKAHNNLGIAMLDLGRTDEAITHLRRAIVLDANNAKAHFNLGVALQHRGALEAAADSYRRALALKPDYAEAYYNLAAQGLMRPDAPGGDAAFALLSAQVETSATAPPRARAALLFAMSKALEGRDPDRAFGYMAEANAAYRTTITFDIAAAEQRMKAIAEIFDAALLHRLQGAGASSERPIFIVGMPRSGTTLVEQIISAHSAVRGAGEIGNLGSVIAMVSADRGAAFPAWATGLTADDCRTLGQAYLDSLPPAAPGQTRLTDKALSNVETIGLIQLCLPHATIIHCERDPRDVCLSCFATRFSDGQDFAYDLVDLGRYWRAHHGLMTHWREVLPPGRMLAVPYEALVQDLETWARRLIAHCGLEWDDACLRFFESEREVRTASFAQVRRPIYSASVGRWRRFEGPLKPLLEALGPLD